MLLHCNQKAEYYLKEDPPTALLVMHMDLVSLLLAHYKRQQKWWVGPHRVLTDLSTWDLKLAQMVGCFLETSEVHAKFQVWSGIIDHILLSSGGYDPLQAQICPCEKCQGDISLLLRSN